MKICICSDSHGNADGLQRLVWKEKPDYIWFLGDGERDWERVELSPLQPFAGVCGNCDPFSQEPLVRRFTFCGKKILLTHGDTFHVKSGLTALEAEAVEHGLDLIFYGHTHRPAMDTFEGCQIVCPGSMGVSEGHYAILELQPDQEAKIQLKRL